MSSLRARTREDLSVVAAWIPDADALYRFAGPWLTWPLSVADLDDLQARPGATAWMLDGDDERPIGHVQLTPANGGVRLGRFIVAPTARGRGWGRRLLSLALDHARAEGASRVQLGVLASNQPARRMYETAGFHPDPDTLDAPILLLARDI